jgi:hypothetical protein
VINATANTSAFFMSLAAFDDVPSRPQRQLT